MTTAVVLAAGRGSRMQRRDDAAQLNAAQRRAADSGVKALIPDSQGRPFLVHILNGLATVGIERVILVVGPNHEAMAAALANCTDAIPDFDFAIQAEPRGTADALLRAASSVGDQPFLVLNSDNLYPAEALTALLTLNEPGLIAFDAATLIAKSNIEADRVGSFALIEVDDHGYLRRLVEKPDVGQVVTMADWPVSMNLWRFDVEIFEACRKVPLSSRGEFELPEAVAQSVESGQRFRAVPLAAGVLDLSSRGDVTRVAKLLGEREL